MSRWQAQLAQRLLQEEKGAVSVCLGASVAEVEVAAAAILVNAIMKLDEAVSKR